jgi:lipopolysaccharide export system permease protein
MGFTILDRQRYWAFLKAYLVCFVSLVSLYIVIDAFTNLDEFFKISEGTVSLLKLMGRYYLVRTSLFYDRLCGVITLLAAIFTVTWMQRNNEHLAMMAAGISTHRALVPVIVSSCLVSLVSIANQELIIPQIAEELQRTHDDDGNRKLKTYSRRDLNDILIHSSFAYRSDLSIEPFNATFPTNRYGLMLHVSAESAQYIPHSSQAPFAGGWLIRGAELSPANAPIDGSVITRLDLDPIERVASSGMGVCLASALVDAFPEPRNKSPRLETGTYFLRTNLTFVTLIQSLRWYEYATTPDLVRAICDPTFTAERQEIGVFLHYRNIRPLLSLTMLGLSLPMVLGGYGRNMFINLGLSLGTSGVFYTALFITQWLGNNRILSPELAAWVPLIGFGGLAAARWDRIRT